MQDKLQELELAACAKWEVEVANLYDDSELDTRKDPHKNRYTFNSLDSNGLPGTNGSGTHPNLAAIEEF